MVRALAVAALLGGLAPQAVAGEAALRFELDGRVVRRLDVAALRTGCGRRIEVEDPYYARRKAFLAPTVGVSGTFDKCRRYLWR